MLTHHKWLHLHINKNEPAHEVLVLIPPLPTLLKISRDVQGLH